MSGDAARPPGADAGRRIAYQPALDGLRGIGVLAVIAGHTGYHGEGFAWASGAFFAISMFFTLSGFLITALLLTEHEANGRIDLRGFWGRRFRRLMPGAIAALGGIALFGWLVADSTQLSLLRGDIAASLGYVANWRLLATGSDYVRQFGNPTPILHFWSLAIEEQFYVVFPLLTVGLLRLGRGSHRTLAIGFGALAALSVGITIAVSSQQGFDPDRVYYGTDTRAAELLAGALLAVYWFRRPSPAAPGGARALELAGAGALVATMAVWYSWSLADDFVYQGVFPAYAGLTLVLIYAAVQPAGVARKILGAVPLRAVGRISYGAYLFHWPILLTITQKWPDLGGGALLSTVLIATLALALVSHELVEYPIRRSRLLPGPQALAGMAAGVVAVGALAFVVTADADPGLAEGGPATSIDPSDVPAGLPRIDFFGDSTAKSLGSGISGWASTTGSFAPVGNAGILGCGVIGVSDVITLGEEGRRPSCEQWPELWEAELVRAKPDLAVVSVVDDTLDHRLDGDREFRGPGDPAYDAALSTQMLRAVDLAHRHGAYVVWILSPHVMWGTVDGVVPPVDYPDNDPARVERMNELIRELPSLRPGMVSVLDLPAYLGGTDGGEMDTTLRPDLVHFAPGPAYELATAFVGPELIRLYNDHVRALTSGNAP